MRPCDLDRSRKDVWIYRPDAHKTAHHGISKAVPIVGDARKAMEPYMDRAPDAYCFSPQEAVRWQREQRSKTRKTPLKWGGRPGSNRKENPKQQPGEYYTKDSYRRAIQRAAKQAGVESWTPYQLRYTAAREAREKAGVEAAQALLGHSHPNMTQHYAKLTEENAIRAAQSLKGIGD
jgi:integrase